MSADCPKLTMSRSRRFLQDPDTFLLRALPSNVELYMTYRQLPASLRDEVDKLRQPTCQGTSCVCDRNRSRREPSWSDGGRGRLEDQERNGPPTPSSSAKTDVQVIGNSDSASCAEPASDKVSEPGTRPSRQNVNASNRCPTPLELPIEFACSSPSGLWLLWYFYTQRYRPVLTTITLDAGQAAQVDSAIGTPLPDDKYVQEGESIASVAVKSI